MQSSRILLLETTRSQVLSPELAETTAAGASNMFGEETIPHVANLQAKLHMAAPEEFLDIVVLGSLQLCRALCLPLPRGSILVATFRESVTAQNCSNSFPEGCQLSILSWSDFCIQSLVVLLIGETVDICYSFSKVVQLLNYFLSKCTYPLIFTRFFKKLSNLSMSGEFVYRAYMFFFSISFLVYN